MFLKHRVKISVSNGQGRTGVLEGGEMTIPQKIVRALFGDGMKVLVITPGCTVSNVEIQEVKEESKDG